MTSSRWDQARGTVLLLVRTSEAAGLATPPDSFAVLDELEAVVRAMVPQHAEPADSDDDEYY